MKMICRPLIILTLLVFSSCAQTPTKVFETEAPKNKFETNWAQDPNLVVIDARPAFEFSLSHVPGSINLRWEDFSQKEEPFLGLLEKDLFFHARRLARMGINPKSKVLVLGRGPQGSGEEGRLAWTLQVLGIKNTRFTHVDNFIAPQREESAPRPSVAIWKPEADTSLWIEKEEFLKLVLSERAGERAPIILDVRSEKEYLGKHHSYFSKKAPDISAMNVPWTEFITSKSETNVSIKDKLGAVGVTPDRDIVVIDDKGVRSAMVTLVLRELGFSKATNFAGGYMQLIGKR